jgi:hypothetical protein
MREKIVICGSRTAKNRAELESWLNATIDTTKNPTIRTGGAEGTDQMAKEWAEKKGLHHEEHPAEWKRYGKKAGPIRNAQMMQGASQVLANWDGTSKGTANALKQARAKGLKVQENRY